MTQERDISRTSQFLNDHPEIRQRVRESDEFRIWNENLPNILIDGKKIYISEGDIQKEEDDLIIDFAIKKNLISIEEFEKWQEKASNDRNLNLFIGERKMTVTLDRKMHESNKSFANVVLNENPELRDSLSSSDLYSKLRAGLSTVTIDDRKFYVVEGDLLLDEDELGIYALRQETFRRVRKLDLGDSISSALVSITEGGKIVRWRDGLVLTYCVLKQTFQSEDQYQEIRDNMLAATEAWEKTCGIKFDYRSELDESNSVRPEGIIFPVRGIDAGGQFIAAAFFPNDPTYRWRVLIDPSYFRTSFDRVGVLRHELGHVLGFRHEHIRSGAPPACPDEPVWGTINLTDYDPQSVMHYFCGGVGTRELRISELDRLGSQRVYGPPLDKFIFIG